jgi:Zn-dependent protease
VLYIIPVVLSLSVHEWAHAYAAAMLGDDTARERGRLTLNPLAHVDVVGTLALPLLGIPFGWAKPVPVEPTRFRAGVSMSKGMLWTAAAGPLSNVVLALFCALALRAVRGALPLPAGAAFVSVLLERGMLINGSLAVFNLLPIPPLDGSRVVDAFVPFEHRATWRWIGTAIAVVLAIVVLALSSRSFMLHIPGE